MDLGGFGSWGLTQKRNQVAAGCRVADETGRRAAVGNCQPIAASHKIHLKHRRRGCQPPCGKGTRASVWEKYDRKSGALLRECRKKRNAFHVIVKKPGVKGKELSALKSTRIRPRRRGREGVR